MWKPPGGALTNKVLGSKDTQEGRQNELKVSRRKKRGEGREKTSNVEW